MEHEGHKDLKVQSGIKKKKKTGRKKNPAGGMDVCVVLLYEDSSMERKVT
jgi:hypothetical protein